METDTLFALSLALIPLFVLAILIVGIVLMGFVFARTGGWAKLAERYKAEHEPQGQKLTFQTLKVGPFVRYRWIVTVVIAREGLYLRPGLWLRIGHSPILIPWSEIKAAQRARLYWWRAVQLTIGDPPVSTITMWMRLFEAIRPYLPAGVAKDL